MNHLSLLFCLLLSSSAWAHNHNEVVFGVLRQSSATNFLTKEKTGPRPGFGFGFKTESEQWSGFSIKLGLMYEERNVTDIFAGVEHNPRMKHLDLLTHVSYRATDFLSVFAGPQFTVLLASDCRPSSGPCLIADGAHKYFVPMTVGLDFTFLEHYGAEVYYEWISQEFWDRTFEKNQTYGLNLKYKF